MKTKVALVLLVLVVACGCASLREATAPLSHSHPSGIREFLEGFAESQSKNEVDYFFVSPVSRQHRRDFAYAYWMTGNSIIILDLPIGKLDDYSWYAGKARVDLATDVVPTQNDIGGSNYLVDAGWAEKIIRESLTSGMKVVVHKNGLRQMHRTAR